MVGFCDLVGTGIAPVSKKTAVKAFYEYLIEKLRYTDITCLILKLLA